MSDESGAINSNERIVLRGIATEPVEATVLDLENGRVVLLPGSRQLIKGRPIVGAEFDVSKKEARQDVFIPPAETHGLWLHLIPR